MNSEKLISVVLLSILMVRCDGSDISVQNGDSKNQVSNPSLSICSGSNPNHSDGGFGGGDGTVGNPYLVCTVEHFKNIQGDFHNKRNFKLTSDIDFSSEGNLRIIAISPFATIDGDGHTIRNIVIEHGHGWTWNGLFGQLVQDMDGHPDEIKDLNIENITIRGDGYPDHAGVIAAANRQGIISNVHVRGQVIVEDTVDGNSVDYGAWSTGGLVGQNFGRIENSSFQGRVGGVYNVGGLVGLNHGQIINSRSSGSVGGRLGVGGIVGVQMQSGTDAGNTSNADVTGLGRFGWLVGLRCPSSEYSLCEMGP